MNRRTLLQALAAMAALPLLPACSKASPSASASASAGATGSSGAAGAAPRAAGSAVAVKRLERPAAYWRDKVSPGAFDVLFKDGTEAPFSSPLDKEKRSGTYVCAACRLPLFNGSAKFDSGTGWPSFTAPIAGHMKTKKDFKLIWPRTEYHCARCGGHQGHVFDDGPAPRGERWCNNGVALAFVPQGQPLPALRG